MPAPFTCRHPAFPEAEKSPTLPAPAPAHAGPERTPAPTRGRTVRGRGRPGRGSESTRKTSEVHAHGRRRRGSRTHQGRRTTRRRERARTRGRPTRGPSTSPGGGRRPRGAIDGCKALRVFAGEPNRAGHLFSADHLEIPDAVGPTRTDPDGIDQSAASAAPYPTAHSGRPRSRPGQGATTAPNGQRLDDRSRDEEPPQQGSRATRPHGAQQPRATFCRSGTGGGTTSLRSSGRSRHATARARSACTYAKTPAAAFPLVTGSLCTS